MKRSLALTLSILLAMALAGCGVADPYAASTRAATPPPPPHAPIAPRDSHSAIEAFARAWINWSARNAARQRGALLALSTGPLARELADPQSVPSAAAAGAMRSRGSVVGLLAGTTQDVVVVTSEEVSGQSAYRVYLARPERTPDGWRVAAWQSTTDN